MDTSLVFIELGAAIAGLAILARIASRVGLMAMPLYLLAGLAFGNGGLLPLGLSEGFIHIGAEIGVLLLLFMLGLECRPDELRVTLRSSLLAGPLDFVFNFTPGFLLGLWLGWQPLAATLLGGVTWISSSGVAARLLDSLQWLNHAETPAVISILVLEDLAMAVYLPLVAALLAGGGAERILLAMGVAFATLAAVGYLAFRHGATISRWVAHESDEVVLLTTFGAVLLVAGLAQRVNVSAAVGAFLVGVAISGPIAEQSHRLLAPLRDLFAATFFFFFGLEIDPATLLPVWPLATLLALVTAGTKIATGYWATRRIGLDRRARWRAGVLLIARGEFSIVLAGLGVGLEPVLGPLTAAYVLTLVIAGPVLARWLR